MSAVGQGVLRRRRAGALGIIVLLAVVAVVIVVLVTSGSGGPADGAARVVPADALALVDVSLDGTRAPVRRAQRIASGLPGGSGLETRVRTRLAAMLGEPNGAAFTAASRSWLGSEAAIAILPGGSGAPDVAGTLVALAVRQPVALARFLRASTGTPDGVVAGVPLRRFPGGAVAAPVGGYLVLGQLGSVRAAIATAHGAAALASAAGYKEATAGEPAGRVLDAYLPRIGLTRLVGERSGGLGALATLVDQPGLRAVSVALSPAGGGVTLRVRSTFSTSVGADFRPTLLAAVPADAGLVLDVHDLAGVAPNLLSAVADTGLAGGLPPLLTRLGAALQAEGFGVGGLLELFSREAAVAVLDSDGRPAVLIVSRTARPAYARQTLASAAAPLEDLFASGATGAEPLFQSRTLDGTAVHQLALGPGLAIDYAVSGDRVLVATSLAAMADALAHGSSLAASPLYRRVLGAGHGAVSSLLFGDLTSLLGLGERTNLLHGAVFRALLPTLGRVSAIGLRATHADHDTTAELYLRIT